MQNPLRTIRDVVAVAQSRGVAPERFSTKSAPVVREVDLEAVRRGLARIRRRRRLAHLPFLAIWLSVPAIGLWSSAGLPSTPMSERSAGVLADVSILVAFGCLFFFGVRGLRCPRCREAFHARRSCNQFARRCQHCGLRLNGANAAEPFTVLGPYD